MSKERRYRIHPNVLLRPHGDDRGVFLLLDFNKPSVVRIDGPVAVMLQQLTKSRTSREVAKSAALKKAFNGLRSKGIIAECLPGEGA